VIPGFEEIRRTNSKRDAQTPFWIGYMDDLDDEPIPIGDENIVVLVLCELELLDERFVCCQTCFPKLETFKTPILTCHLPAVASWLSRTGKMR
jgi:hypothetical protein